MQTNGMNAEAVPHAPFGRIRKSIYQAGMNGHSATTMPHHNRPLGFSLFMWGNDDAPGRDKYRLMLEGAKYFDRNGFEAVWTPERHFHAFGGPYPNPSVTAAAIASVTERIGIRAGSCVSPLHHPIRIAEEWAVVDNLSNGRVALAFASGWQTNDFVLRPENHAENKRVMLEQIDQVRRLWRGEKFPFRNPLGQEVAIQTLPRPVQPELPFWITTAGNPDTYRQAGQLGANVLTHLLGQSIDQVAEKIIIYRQARVAAGLDPFTGRVTLMLHTFVGDDDSEVRELVRQPMKDYLRSSLALLRDVVHSFSASRETAIGNRQDLDLRGIADSDLEVILDSAFERYFETSGFFGTPTTCARMVERCKRAGVDEIACLLDFGVPTERVMASLSHLSQLRERANANASEPHSSDLAKIQRPAMQPAVVEQPTADTQIYTFLTTLRERDIHLSADGDRLRCSAPPGALTSDLRGELQRRKPEILKFLQSATTLGQQQRAIVPLQSEGERTPVFAFAGHNGDVFCYRALARHLGEDQPFFGLQPPGLDGLGKPLTRVEDLAACFADQIRAFRPGGPYIIAGYCAGGTIAFELARQLLQNGVRVDFLVLFGSPFPTWYRPLSQLHWRLGHQLKWAASHALTVMTLPPGESRSYVAEKLRSRKMLRHEKPPATPDPVLMQREKVGEATLAAIRRYEPGHFAGRLHLFLPNKWLSHAAVLAKWRSVADHAEGHFGPDGCTGDSMLREPYASAFANLFKQCRDLSAQREFEPASQTAARVSAAIKK
jgi:natural product biosynthesis luciferase-like monooxygenase protein